jgi:nucleotide-binding universal stress UspA family protein
VTWPERSPARLLVAVDGSPTATRAAEAAVAIAARHGADLCLLHVLDDDRLRELAAVVAEDAAEAQRRLEKAAGHMLEGLGELAREKGVACTARVESGDPPRVIEAVARECGADMIVVGKVGQRGVRSWFMGSVARRLIETSSIPVVVIPGSPS